MGERQRRSADAIWVRRPRPEALAAFLILATVALLAPASMAQANTGYVPESAHPSRTLPGPPRGLTVDQGTGDIYVAITSTNPSAGTPGEIARYNSDLSADGTFAVGGGFYSGVALDPISGGFFAAQLEILTPFGNVGTSRLDRFSSTGSSAGSFALDFTDSLPQIITDSAGHIYYPNVNTHSVEVLSSGGTLLENITCGGCPGGAFGKPAAVALDSTGALYVADANPDRVVKLTLSGGHYAYDSVLQSGRGAGAVAVDTGNGDILVGDMPGGRDYHVVAYDSSGTQFDDFAAGLSPDSTTGYGALSAYQLAVNSSTHIVYIGSIDRFFAFEQGTIGPPSATAEAATAIAQQGATLSASVNANGHAVLECEFEYTDEADFLAHEFSAASDLPCPQKPDGTVGVHLSAKALGLSPSTVYRYRLTAASNGGSAVSGEKSFETLPELPPEATTEAAQAIAQTMATIRGSVNPRGGTVSDCHFELGTSVAYGTSISCPTSLGTATSSVAEAPSLTGLTPVTTYHYRVIVHTNAGTATGKDVEFTTAALPVEPQPEAPVSTPAPVESPPAPAPPAPPRTVAPPGHHCKKGFRRERVHGKAKCVRRKRRHHRHA
jgi:DNA-binding beta-propeller fold protein YncE